MIDFHGNYGSNPSPGLIDDDKISAGVMRQYTTGQNNFTSKDMQHKFNQFNRNKRQPEKPDEKEIMGKTQGNYKKNYQGGNNFNYNDASSNFNNTGTINMNVNFNMNLNVNQG